MRSTDRGQAGTEAGAALIAAMVPACADFTLSQLLAWCGALLLGAALRARAIGFVGLGCLAEAAVPGASAAAVAGAGSLIAGASAWIAATGACAAASLPAPWLQPGPLLIAAGLLLAAARGAVGVRSVAVGGGAA